MIEATITKARGRIGWNYKVPTPEIGGYYVGFAYTRRGAESAALKAHRYWNGKREQYKIKLEGK